MTEYAKGRKISDQVRYREIAAVIATAFGKVIFMDVLEWRLPFIVIAMAAWVIYIVIHGRSRGTLSHWGFRLDNFGRAVKVLMPFAVTAVFFCILVGYLRETINLTWHIFPILILYPLWGSIQQFLVIALVAGNLRDMEKGRLSTPLIIVLTAFLFGAVHYPHYWLIAGTFGLALLYGHVFLKVPNIYALGVFHGWLGGVFFYTVVDRDPFEEVFGILATM